MDPRTAGRGGGGCLFGTCRTRVEGGTDWLRSRVHAIDQSIYTKDRSEIDACLFLCCSRTPVGTRTYPWVAHGDWVGLHVFKLLLLIN